LNKYILEAEAFCEKNKHRFTQPRKEVLEVITSHNTPLSAYDILKILSVEKEVKPPTVYRAIEFWLKHGFIHRVESINAYIVCDLSHRHQGTQIIICDSCGMTKEICLNDFEIKKRINTTENFKVTDWNIEIRGLCKNCA